MRVLIKLYLYWLIVMIFLVSCKQFSKTIGNTKEKNTSKIVGNHIPKKSIEKVNNSLKCLDNIDSKSNVYPINEKVCNDYEFYNKIKETEVNMFNNKDILNISCEGATYRVKCYDNIDYLFIPAQECGEYETHLAIIKKDEPLSLIRLFGANSRYESLDYILNKDYLEVTKTYFYEYTADGSKDDSKIIKKTIKYKLTDKGLLEFQ